MLNNSVLKILPKFIQKILYEESSKFVNLQEIRLRAGKPLIIIANNQESVCELIVQDKEIHEMLSYISNYSLYAYENEMKQGFITVEGGHRIGLCGQVILENGKVKNLKYISSINVRIAHEVVGCADEVYPYLSNNGQLYHTLIISPPKCGKTTILRDIIRQISDGNKHMRGKTVGVVDERSEIGGCYKGIAQNQLGKRTDILDGCPKVEGMLMLIRSMGPEVIAVDEIGTYEDVQAIEYAIHCGCKIIATAHGFSLEDIHRKPVLGKMINDKKFERYVVLDNQKKVGNIEGVYDADGRRIDL